MCYYALMYLTYNLYCFRQEADDNDYHSEASLSDNVDTDFSIDENDEVRSDDDDEPRRKKRLVTKAYRVWS